MRRTKEEAEQTRRDIIEAAEQLFLANGVAHTSLEMIARECGVTRGAVYWHFQNKAHLFYEMLNEVRTPMEVLTQQLCSCQGRDPIVSLRDLCVNGMMRMTQDERTRRIMTILLHRCEFTEELREAEERNNVFISQFIELCEKIWMDQKSRLQPGVTPRLAAQAVHSMFIGLISDWLRDPKLFDPTKELEILIDATFRGLARDWDQAMSAV
ncbi:TetR family transcriptional regulator [Pseudomonas asuensis]|jgi:TetR/AcrR family transcriptional repressor of mexAB-oprM operon|uniref:TetR family transcriptional regulator n=1 Tax=Pseudomonas asuensis TaxID=1825787 RepID=A0ABQ2GV13_9PSED|nr:TetR family transcriptional regulator [Pseudomonas asuensis]GGM12228.1 TetR family transcriptional regulator [Pseudomonas asuensis]